MTVNDVNCISESDVSTTTTQSDIWPQWNTTNDWQFITAVATHRCSQLIWALEPEIRRHFHMNTVTRRGVTTSFGSGQCVIHAAEKCHSNSTNLFPIRKAVQFVLFISRVKVAGRSGECPLNTFITATHVTVFGSVRFTCLCMRRIICHSAVASVSVSCVCASAILFVCVCYAYGTPCFMTATTIIA